MQLRTNAYDAVIIGSGPNGLAAAITLAREQRSVLLIEAKDKIGGGLRTEESTLPGFNHDICAAVHPLAQVSPFFETLDLAKYGLSWIQPPVPMAHPIDDDRPILLSRSMNETALSLRQDKDNYNDLIGPFLKKWKHIIPELLKPLGIPRHPLLMAKFGLLAAQTAQSVAFHKFTGPRARALFAGNSAHSILPLDNFATAGYGLMLSIAGHAVGWPICHGGSQNFANAMAAYFEQLGGEVLMNTNIRDLAELPPARCILLDLTPKQIDSMGSKVFPREFLAKLQNHAYGPGVFKMDWALKEPIPWKFAECSQAGTLHLGGSFEEIALSERMVHQGRVSERPFVLLTQPSLFDNARAPNNQHTAWAYCHVPNGCTTDMTIAIENQIERFAPGFRDVVLARRVMFPADMEKHNANYIGGDIAGGVQSFSQIFIKPLGRWRPYSTPIENIYICSSSMPPGAGVHGMCGYLAAKLAIKEHF